MGNIKIKKVKKGYILYDACGGAVITLTFLIVGLRGGALIILIRASYLASLILSSLVEDFCLKRSLRS